MKRRIRILIDFLDKIESEGFLYAVENFADEISDEDEACSECITGVVDSVTTLKEQLQGMIDDAVESGDLSEEDVPEILEYW